MRRSDWELLEARARSIRERARARYSGYRVGAALLGEDGEVYAGTNIENASFGLCLCAERSAVAAAVAAGVVVFRGLAVVVSGDRPAAPCGMCRQVLIEFPPSFPVRCYGEGGDELRTTVAELMPHAFDRGYLDR